ncbi:MFS transporter [Sporomusa acidovorans]|uniref:Major facilitator superfamily (MFS) profile domain-containing protein n=1 Tax=Sporomusa acidovorans (strain ATCC 49682 / DSM 3132 / Mol) TaxID=1123286 RepID=A0ABZ3J726_SPOA4|nr:MFS transporter [Sporomusa acidovorans]OZC18531.1 multidrug resistance protein D [Sporomusa acidovorans DSM 3132]SDE37470.1 Predicted arabinose efflux permease, MFS family [Sporomusa acidovorans]
MKNNRLPILIAIILICVAPMADTFILIPAMADIAKALPDVSGALISFILTISSLFVIPSSLIAGKIVSDNKLNKKSALLIGFTLFTIGGAAGGLYPNIYWILFTRAVEGIGLGFATAMVATITADYYCGHERANVMGLYTAIGGAISIGLTLLGGYLAMTDWRLSFTGYLLCALIVVYDAIVLERKPIKSAELLAEEEQDRKEMEAALAADAGRKPRLGKSVWFLVGLTFVSQIIGNMLYLFMAIFMDTEKLGDAIAVGEANGITTIVIVVFSLLFGVIYSRLKGFTTVFFFTFIGLGYFLLARSTDYTTCLIAFVVWAVGFSVTIPYIYTEATILPPKNLVTICGALINSTIFLAYTLSAFVQPVIVSMFHNDSLRFMFNVLGVVMGVCAVVSAIYYAMAKRVDSTKINHAA